MLKFRFQCHFHTQGSCRTCVAATFFSKDSQSLERSLWKGMQDTGNWNALWIRDFYWTALWIRDFFECFWTRVIFEHRIEEENEIFEWAGWNTLEVFALWIRDFWDGITSWKEIKMITSSSTLQHFDLSFSARSDNFIVRKSLYMRIIIKK